MAVGADDAARGLHYRKEGVERTVEVKGNLGANAMEDIAAAVEAGIGIARTLRRLAEAALRDGPLKAVLNDWSSPPQPVSIVYPQSRYPSAKVRIFADFLSQTLGGGSRERHP